MRQECEWVQQRIHELLISGLRGRRRGKVARHLLGCRSCRQYLRRMRRLPGLLASVAPMPPPPGLADYIKGACLLSAGMDYRPAASRAIGHGWAAAVTAAAAIVVLAVGLRAVLAPQATVHMRPVVMAVAPAEPQAPPRPFEDRETVEAVHEAPALPAVRGSASRPSLAASGPPRPHARVRQQVAGQRRGRARVVHRGRSSSAEARAGEGSLHAMEAVRPRVPSVRLASLSPWAYVQPRARAGEGTEGDGTEVAEEEGVESSGKTEGGGGEDDRAVEGGPVNEAVAANVAAGLIASALLERYVADAVAEQGAHLATASVVSHGGSPDIVDTVATDEDVPDLGL